MENIRFGYKKTKVGIIPENWSVVKIGDVFDFIKTYSNSRNDLSSIGDIEYLHYGDIHTKYKYHLDFDKNLLPKISLEKLKTNIKYVKDGDLFIADASEDYADIGKSVEAVNLNNKKVVSGLHTFLLRDNNDNFANRYKGLIFYNQNISKSIKRIATGITVLGISKTNLGKLEIPLPSIKEQGKIAEILTTWDKAISIQDELIKTKYKLKKGLMQVLLTGKVRFSPFNNDWKEVNIKDIALTSIGLVTTMTKSYVEIGVPLIRNSDIKQNKVRKEKLIYLNHDFANRHENRKLRLNDIVTVHTGEIGVSAIIDESLNGCHGFATLNTRIFDANVLPEYVCWYFNSEKNINFAFSMATGDGRSNFNLKDFNRTKIPLPSFQEQQKIAKVLSNADKEIDLFKNELEELKEQKKGLMQKLLTGEVRVKI